jgi:hypothetical protein
MAKRPIETRQKALAFEAEGAEPAAWWKTILGEPLTGVAGEPIYFVDQATYDQCREKLEGAIGPTAKIQKIWIHGRRLVVFT